MKEIMKTETAVGSFVVLETPIERIREAIKMNLGDTNVSIANLIRIKLPTGGATTWTINKPDGTEITEEIEGIIIFWRDTRVFWRVPLDQAAGNAPPSCHSVDAVTGVGDPGGACGRCQFANASLKGERPACRLTRELYLLQTNKYLPLIVCLSPTSVKPAKQYLAHLTTGGEPCYTLITKIALERATNKGGMPYSRAKFSSGRPLTPEEAVQIREYALMFRSIIIARADEQREGEA